MKTKSICAISGFVLLCFLFSTCKEATVEETTTQVATTTASSLTIPGRESIILMPDGYFESMYDLSFELTRRACYYMLPGWVEDLVDDPDAIEYVNEMATTDYTNHLEEMMLKRYIIKYQIPKEAFVAALEKDIEISIKLGIDITNEEFEPPNPDIIYTFDDEIINEYYRRER